MYFMLSEEMQIIPEEIYVKNEQLFPSSEDDKVGWIWFELFINYEGSGAMYLR